MSRIKGRPSRDRFVRIYMEGVRRGQGYAEVAAALEMPVASVQSRRRAYGLDPLPRADGRTRDAGTRPYADMDREVFTEAYLVCVREGMTTLREIAAALDMHPEAVRSRRRNYALMPAQWGGCA